MELLLRLLRSLTDPVGSSRKIVSGRDHESALGNPRPGKIQCLDLLELQSLVQPGSQLAGFLGIVQDPARLDLAVCPAGCWPGPVRNSRAPDLFR